MTDTNQPKRLAGALLSGVIYLDEQGAVQDVHWCLTADGPAPDIQPVIRTGDLAGAAELLPAMLEELADRFGQAAALETAKATRTKKKTAAPSQPAARPAAAGTAESQESQSDSERGQPPDGEEEAAPAEDAPETLLEGEALETALETPPTIPAPQSEKPVQKKANKAAPAMSSLFDGLDLS